MAGMYYEEKRQARENLLRAFNDMKRKHFSRAKSGSLELRYRGVESARSLTEKFSREIDELIAFINTEETKCDSDLQLYCPNFYKALAESRTMEWRTEKEKQEALRASARIQKALADIDGYVEHRSPELAKDFVSGIKDRIADIKTHGLGRPWGTEIRQRVATAIGLKQDVDSLWTMGMNSVANSQNVYLGEHFIQKIKDDPAMTDVRLDLELKICNDIRKNAFKAPYIEPKSIERRISGALHRGFGGERDHSVSMMKQLELTLKNPVASLVKHANTWNVAMNELTWTIRNATVKYNGVYHSIYNIIGYIYFWEMEFSIADPYDLRPRFGGKINFDSDYNIMTTILGSVYHDILGNTDQMQIRAMWTEMSDNNEKINLW